MHTWEQGYIISSYIIVASKWWLCISLFLSHLHPYFLAGVYCTKQIRAGSHVCVTLCTLCLVFAYLFLQGLMISMILGENSSQPLLTGQTLESLWDCTPMSWILLKLLTLVTLTLAWLQWWQSGWEGTTMLTSLATQLGTSWWKQWLTLLVERTWILQRT